MALCILFDFVFKKHKNSLPSLNLNQKSLRRDNLYLRGRLSAPVLRDFLWKPEKKGLAVKIHLSLHRNQVPVKQLFYKKEFLHLLRLLVIYVLLAADAALPYFMGIIKPVIGHSFDCLLCRLIAAPERWTLGFI